MRYRHDHTVFLERWLLFGFIPIYSGCSRKEWKKSMKKFKEGNSDGALHQMWFAFPLGFEMLSYDADKFENGQLMFEF